MQAGAGSSGLSAQIPDLPAGWQVVRTSGPLGFITHMDLIAPDGTEYAWTSRRHRKRLGLVTATAPGQRAQRASPTSWWLAAFFGAGSICFALGSVPLFFNGVDSSVVAWTFFVGSVFFTTAGWIQFQETVTASDAVLAAPHRLRLRRILHLRPRGIDWWAALIQLAGTIAFNVSTFAATRNELAPPQEKHLIWTPDVVGSICFLIASWLAYAEVNRGILPRSDRSVGWRIGAVNLLGSIAFGAAAVAARYLPTSGQPANITLVNLGTFLGAACFLLGAVLLPVESAKDSASALSRR
ncbi:MAG TPA: hypothetical protein VIP98_12310 [Microlunatus sp.]